MNNIAQAFISVAHETPKATALITKEPFAWRKWTFADLEEMMMQRCHALKSGGVKPGDRVILMVKPSAEFVALTFALFAMGAIIILIDPGMGYKNLLKCVGSVKPTVFIGILKAQLFKLFFPKPFTTVRVNFQASSPWPLFGRSLGAKAKALNSSFTPVVSRPEDLAAILFTTGSTGPPKGVEYQHGIFQAQLEMISTYYKIGSGEIDQPAFPLFALFSVALGATAVIPDMDPTRPAQINPAKFIKSIKQFGVTYSFGSPAIWNVVSRYCQTNNIKLDSLQKILMAGAPVPGDLIKRTKSVMASGGEVHIPYGATECLPIISMTGSEVVNSTWPLTMAGKGTCVGRPLPGIEVLIIPACDTSIALFAPEMVLPVGQIGEIIVRGRVVTKSYANNDSENEMAKIQGGEGGFWHRIGDMGYFDDDGKLWFCGRKAHRVITRTGTMYSVCCEAVFNRHPLVYRSALVGVKHGDVQIPILIVEPQGDLKDMDELFVELRAIACQYKHTQDIHKFMVNRNFPVDIRHNAKIFREKLALWATKNYKDKK